MLKKIAIIILVTITVYSCTKDLNTEPRIEQSLDNLLDSDPNGILGILARLYGGLVLHGTGAGGGGEQDIAGDDAGETVFFRNVWNVQELTTDIAKNRWGDGGLDPLTTATGWVPTNKFFGYMYNRSYFNIAQINNFIIDVQKADVAEANLFIAEARYLRALHYYYLMDLFGGVVLVTEADGVTGVLKAKETRETIFAFVESELLEIEEAIPVSNDYGRANRAAVHMLLAKIYLNAEIYTGTAQYDKALLYSERVIMESSFTLDNNYQSIFQGDNYTSSEIIFPLIGDRASVQSFGNATYLTNASSGDTTMPIGDFGNSEGWFGHRCTPALYSLFGDLSSTQDSRAIFWTEGHNFEMTDYKTWEDGYPTTKFRNSYSDGSTVESRFSDTDIPLFRLSDAYLMYAEASLRGGGSMSQAVDYINALRERAYGDTSGNITAPELTLDFMARKENIIITGASGLGKSYLGQALGHQACMMQYRTIYSNTARLLKRLKLSKVDGTYLRELNKLLKADLLILDDFGLQSFDNHAREALMDIIDDRHNKTFTIISSQIPVSAWYDIIGEGTIADAILDRIVNSSHRIDLKGESLRKGILKNE